jgi:hypothetical protein
MNGHSSNYQHHLDCDPGRFDNNELVRRYQAGEQLFHCEKKDAEAILRQRAKHQAIMAEFDRAIGALRRA